jgi:hypothetical protein
VPPPHHRAQAADDARADPFLGSRGKPLDAVSADATSPWGHEPTEASRQSAHLRNPAEY